MMSRLIQHEAPAEHVPIVKARLFVAGQGRRGGGGDSRQLAVSAGGFAGSGEVNLSSAFKLRLQQANQQDLMQWEEGRGVCVCVPFT